VYVATLDGHVLALRASDGRKIWDSYVLTTPTSGYFVSAPLAVRDRVYVGNAGSDIGAIGYMFAFDRRTGRLVWDTSLVAMGNSPAANTWPKRRGLHIAGGGTWTSYTFDPAANLLYVPAGNPGPDFDGDYRIGANLYTNSIVALDGTNGAIRAYRQLVPHDVHDWDVSTAPALFTTRAGSAVAAVVGKNGYLYELDPRLTHILWRTPTTTIANADAPITPQGTRFCPGTQGGTEFNPVAYSPQTNLLYTTSVDWCTTIKLAAKTKYVPGKPFVGSQNGFGTTDPISKAKGWLTAVDADTGRVRWKWKASLPLLAAVVPTAGGVVFTGDLRGNFIAFDARTGRQLYRYNVGGAMPGGLAAYSTGGKEYVAAVVGYPGPIWKTPKMTDKIVVFSL
jgi:glucose dehydrogenase